MVTGFSLILVNDDFLSFAFAYYSSRNGSVSNIFAYFKAVVTHCDYLVKCNSISFCYVQFFNLQNVTFGNLYCFPPVAIIAYIGHLLFPKLANCGDVPEDTLLPRYAAYSYIIASSRTGVNKKYEKFAIIFCHTSENIVTVLMRELS